MSGTAFVDGVCTIFFLRSLALLIFERGAKMPKGQWRILVGGKHFK